MILYHVTPGWNQQSIDAHGLDSACSATGQRAVYLCDRRLIPWAIQHVAERHHCRIPDTLVYRVRLDGDEPLTQYKPGLYRLATDVPPARLRAIIHPKRRRGKWHIR